VNVGRGGEHTEGRKETDRQEYVQAVMTHEWTGQSHNLETEISPRR